MKKFPQKTETARILIMTFLKIQAVNMSYTNVTTINPEPLFLWTKQLPVR